MADTHKDHTLRDILASGETYEHLIVYDFLNMQDSMADPTNFDVPPYSSIEFEMMKKVVLGHLERDLKYKKVTVCRDINFGIICGMLAEFLVQNNIQITHDSFIFLNTFLESLMFRWTECPHIDFTRPDKIKCFISSSFVCSCLAMVNMSKSSMIEENDDSMWAEWIETL